MIPPKEDKECKYLRSMPIDSLIEENIEKLNKDAETILKAETLEKHHD